jgi:hypothetical protein
MEPAELLDREHLRLLRIGYFISAAQSAVMVPFGVLYAGLGVIMRKISGVHATDAALMTNWVFGMMGAFIAVFALVATILKLLTAKRLEQRRSRVLCLVTAALSCIEVPYGTALGVFTFLVLGRSSVRQQFDG